MSFFWGSPCLKFEYASQTKCHNRQILWAFYKGNPQNEPRNRGQYLVFVAEFLSVLCVSPEEEFSVNTSSLDRSCGSWPKAYL